MDVFAREKNGLDESIADIRAGGLVRGLLARNPGSGLGAFARMDALPEMRHASHLLPLLADHPFQENFKHLRDLQFLRENLLRWQASLGTYTDMLDSRRAAFAERLPRVRERSGAVDLPRLRQRSAALAAELARVEKDGDASAFATPRERDLLDRIERARATLARAEAAPAADGAAGLADAAERLRRASGALTWQLAQQFSARSWVARKALRDAEQALEGAGMRDAALLAAQQAEPERHERLARRIAELERRVQALQPRVDALDAQARSQLQDIAVAELEGQKERLDLYAAQARMAIAQIMDRAQLVQNASGPGPGAAGGKP